MHAWEAVQKALDAIEENLSEELTPEELSKIAALSPFYFQRLFKRLVNRPVGDYIKMRRLARASKRMLDQDARIVDIALECGFNSHESLTKAFKSAFGFTPEEYRARPVPLNQVIKPELLLHYALIDENVPLIADSIVLEITRKTLTVPELYIGLAGQVPLLHQMPMGEVTGIDVPGQLWDSFHLKKPNIPNLAPDGHELGASLPGQKMGCFTYFAGALALNKEDVPGDCTPWELPAGEYVVCGFEAENFEALVTSALDKAMKYLYGVWLKAHHLTSLPFSAEKYYKVTPDATYMEIWVIPAPIQSEAGR